MGEAMEEGKLAAANGEPLSANPYPQDSEDYEEWAEGWHYLQDVDEEGEPSDNA